MACPEKASARDCFFGHAAYRKISHMILLSRFWVASAKYIEDCLKPLLDLVRLDVNQKKVILHQDLTSAHRAKKTKEFIRKILLSFV